MDMRFEPLEFQKLDLCCHALLRDVPLHDVWAIPLIGGGPGRSVADARAILFGNQTREGPFRVLYVFGDEALNELRNATMHGFLALALTPRAGGYTLYLGIYVKPVSRFRFTGCYLALIDLFRRLVVYPALAWYVQRRWALTYASSD